MAKTARLVVRLVSFTPEAGPVGIAAGSTDPMAADAQLLAGTAVATGARRRVDAGLHAVVPPSSSGRDPSLRVRAARARALSHMVVVVAALAGVLTVAGRTEARVGASLHRVPCDEACAVKAGEGDLVEHELGRQFRDGPDAVARGTRSLRVAARAEIACTRRPNPVLAQPVAVVNEVAHGRRILRRKVLVAAVAVTKRPLILVLVATEARGHLGPDRVRVLFRNSLVTADAVAVCGCLMGAMFEA
jgi:hypothetical protein